MKKQNQTETKNSLFTEIELDEAVNVNGGEWTPADFNFTYPGGFLTAPAYFLNQRNRSNFNSILNGGNNPGLQIVILPDGSRRLARDLYR